MIDSRFAEVVLATSIDRKDGQKEQFISNAHVFYKSKNSNFSQKNKIKVVRAVHIEFDNFRSYSAILDIIPQNTLNNENLT